ncbi:NHLP bacteriocin system secretion protein [Calothrix sp. UHCC 0171]|uniref:NHLP bacteriocin system secretion protein n=1 Tax=Calothrix sp. UHCC 0171 TaxID=3110245 RepID=UPI002B21E5B7|nr:NHLP bacteriocin system secretion protein [Calothrix sp. UHCC 0171]MEA5574370.1 NHLP bacteriocin system secretion protein [Calothrix sp. UHCC 0171]
MVTQPKNNIFRKEALEKVASPEQLDLLIKVTNPKRWFSLFALGSLVAAGGAWSWFGRIPILVSGKGVLVFPSKVVTVQAANPGRILQVNVEPGDKVKKGQVIATIDQSELRNQLQLARDKLVQLRSQDQTAQIAQTQRLALEQSAIAQQRQTLQQSLQTVQSLTPELRDKSINVLKKERENLQLRLRTIRELQPTLKKRWEQREQLFKQGAVPKDTALQAQQEYLNSQTQLNEVLSQLNQLEVKEVDAKRSYQQSLNQVNELEAQLKALNSRQATQQEQDLVTATSRAKEITETERAIAQLELQLRQSSEIISQHSGRILEITAKAGQQLEPGAALGTISAQQSTDKLVNVTFLPVSEGKKIKPGMTLQITPSTVKREEFGGIKAVVKQISPFPVTQQGAASLVGNPDILPNIINQGAHVAVFTELEQDTSTKSGYKWSSSQGPDQKITSGTTTSVRITTDEKRPIEFILPIFKEWTGVN